MCKCSHHETQHKGRVYETHLLRRSYRENGKVKHETLGNLSHLPPAALDGLYIVRTDVGSERLSAEEVVLAYKSLSVVERAFRTMKTIDLKVRPIHHRREDRVRERADKPAGLPRAVISD